MLLLSLEEDIGQISSMTTTPNNFLVIFVGIALELEKVGPICHHFGPPFLRSVIGKKIKSHFLTNQE